MDFDSAEFLVTTDSKRLDFAFVCRSLHTTRWAKDRPEAIIVESFRNSLCFGLFYKPTGEQVGFARVVTDKVVASLVDDVFVDPRFRKRGLGKWLMACVVSHPWVHATKSRLGTSDAHGLYEKFGYLREEVMRRYPGPPSV